MPPICNAMLNENTLPERAGAADIEIRVASPGEAPILTRILYDAIHQSLRGFGNSAGVERHGNMRVQVMESRFDERPQT